MPDANAWKSRSIYQVLTDRFATTESVDLTVKHDCNERRYCGGTWRGIISQLDYIQGMGFDAVWISPIVKNIEEVTLWGEAYHGYWQEDLYSVNCHFGTTEDLVALSDALHARDMYLMVDVVANHMASTQFVNFARFRPFNDASYYHRQKIITNYENQKECEEGWLGDYKVPLPDLDTENPTVVRTFHWYIKALVDKFKIDGLRIDTVKHVAKSFWPGFVQASGVFCMGEVLHGDPDYLSSYQPYIGGLLDYGTYYPLKRAFHRDGGSMYELAQLLSPEYRDRFTDVQQMGCFMENHDMPRFPNDTSADQVIIKNALAWTFLNDGIPILYYGQEFGFDGNGDPGSREVMWTTGFKKTELYYFIRILNAARKVAWSAGFGDNLAMLLGNNDNIIATQKGPLLMVLTNLGSSAKSKPLTLATGFSAGTILINVLTKQSLQVSKRSLISITVEHGLPQIYLPLQCASQIYDDLPPTSYAKKWRICPTFASPRVLANSDIKSQRSPNSKQEPQPIWDFGIAKNPSHVILPVEKASQDPVGGEVLYPPHRAVDAYSIFGETRIRTEL